MSQNVSSESRRLSDCQHCQNVSLEVFVEWGPPPGNKCCQGLAKGNKIGKWSPGNNRFGLELCQTTRIRDARIGKQN